MDKRHSYAGDTTKQTDIRTANGKNYCRDRDGTNSVDFGPLASSSGAYACHWGRFGEVFEGDIRLNSSIRWTVDPLNQDCSQVRWFDVESVMTHEWGHIWGLGHVSEKLHPFLTMSTQSEGPCQDSERTLGLGDALVLNEAY